ncbi:flagellar hook-length control protein FliK [Fictibacillus phosphorivorans]|uniref:flagellar hook-length control protein FliK n=1 Tax=Fictibacillus phosphorivorans TaxID=1221500 RepID=UPI001D1789AD|nr:flagellar hook-length control protein FliK [Fictibacillus phosphorivorans]
MISQPVVSGVQSSPGSGSSKKSNSMDALFSQLLASSTTENEGVTEGLGEMIASILGNIEGLEWSSELLDNETVQSLLNDLPPEMKEVVEKLLESEIDFSDIAINPSPEMKLALLLQLVVNEEVEPFSQKNQKQITEMISRWFPGIKLDQKDSLTKQTEQIFGEIKKLLSESSSNDKNTFLKVFETLSAEKKVKSFADQAFQRYVPTAKSVETNVSASKDLQTVQSPLSPIEQWTLKVPVTGGEGQKEQFVREVQQIISRGKLFVTESGFTKMQIRLTPEHLGNIEIQLIQKHGEITAKIIASSQGAKDALDSQLTQLKQAFTSQDIDFEKIDVFLNGDEQTFDFRDQHNQAHEDQQHAEQNMSEDENSDHLSFNEQLSQLVLNEKV